MSEPRTAERERLIHRLLAERRLVAQRTVEQIPRRPPGARVPLSSLQEGMWFLDRLEPGSAAYVVATNLRLTGRLEIASLRAAADRVVARHEALRTSFTVGDDGRAEQVVVAADDPAARVPFTLDDLTGLPGDERERRALELLQDETETGFDLGRAPLLRIRLLRLADDEHLLALCVHHIVCDERSLTLIMAEFLDGYQRLVAPAAAQPESGGAPAAATSDNGDAPATAQPLSDGASPDEGEAAPVQFPDYLLWHLARAGDRAGGHEAFWRDQLAGSTGVLALPTDRPRPARQTFSGATRSFDLPAGLTAAVDRAARDAGCTRFMIVLTALAVTLRHWSGQDDVCVGSAVSGRADPRLSGVVGPLVNTAAFRVDLSGDPTLAELLRRVRRMCLDTIEHAELPLERVVELARLPRDPGRNPLFQVMCVVNPAGGTRALPGLRIEPVPMGRRSSRMDVTLMVYESSPELTGVVDYNTDLFDPETVDRFIDRFRLALAALGTGPDRRLSDVELIGAAEGRTLRNWSGGSRWYPPLPASGLAGLVAEQAARTPSALAVVGPEGELSYGELVDRAEQLAVRLRRLGVGAEVPVGLALPAGVAGIVGLLGILAAGGGYLPLDPGHPGPRLLGLLDDAGAPVTVTGPEHAARLAGFPGTLLLVDGAGCLIDDGSRQVAAADGPVPGLVRVHPDQLAYVIYTSGSTGRPKGVMVSHRTAANLTHAFVELHGIGPDDRLLMLPPLSFDASVGDLLPALVSGATLVVHPRPAELTGHELLRYCAEQRITLVDTAVALWARWVADLAADGGPVPATPLRAVLFGGEAAQTGAVREWARLTAGRIRLYHHYGPTEGTVCATNHSTVSAEEVPGAARLPIGRPLPNVRVHLLDAQLRPVPVGATGEVHLGGLAPARGYLGAPGLTAGRFVPDPYGQPGGRLYRTGDVARYRPDGALEFLGRTDRQVKIRGHRIEVGEVEAACAAQPGVARAAVTVRDDGAGPRLVGYLVPTDPAEPPVPATVRAALRQRLPDYLVPTALVVLAELPLNAHGKLDEAALPTPATTDRDRAHVPPRTGTEQTLAGIWADLLGVATVGARDNFFDLGGHSLLAGPLIARIEAVLGVRLPLRVLFDTVDLAGLATLVERARSGPATAGPATAGPTAGGSDRDGSAGTGVAAGGLLDRVRADAQLPDDVCATAPEQPPAAEPRRVLVTGATGFLGAHLVARWLDGTGAELHCLVRAGSEAAAVARIRDNLARYGLWHDRYAPRLVGVPGDLAEPALGLRQRDFDALADGMDAIVHNGGVVNFLASYERLRPANVGGTLEVLRLAGRGRPSALHFVSTLGVFLTPARTGTVVREADLPDDCAGLGDGYNSSKWAADALVRAAGDRGLPVTVHRPARITGHSVTGAGNAEDYFSRLLTAFVQLGAVPEIPDDDADLTPVDVVAAGIAELAAQPRHRGGTFHYYNNRTISFAGLAAALASYGFPVRLLPYRRWRDLLLARPDTALAPFIPLFEPQEPRRTQPSFDCTVTEAALVEAGVTCPPADTALIHTYLDWYVRTGVLPPPSAGSSDG